MTDVRLDDRSEKTIATLLPPAQVLCRRFLVAAQAYLNSHATGVTVRAISGLRSFAEQQDLYDKGRSKPGAKVTNAKPGSSWHNYAVAFDIGLFRGEKYLEDSAMYYALGAVGVACGLEWGGNWKSIKDEPHYQLALGISLAEALRRHNAGTSVLEGTPFAQQPPAVETVPKRQVLVTQPSQEPKGWTVITPDKTFHAEADETAGIRLWVETHGGTVNADAATRTITVSIGVGK